VSRDIVVEILTPDRRLFDGPVSEVILPAHDGQCGILPGHGDFVGLLGTGVLRAVRDANPEFFMISGGLYSVNEGQLTVFAELAESVADINLEQARARVAEIEQTFADHAHYNPADYDTLKSDYEKNRARVNACQRQL
jgi:F-type H+-transporting ATPase subunit epsilon